MAAKTATSTNADSVYENALEFFIPTDREGLFLYVNNWRLLVRNILVRASEHFGVPVTPRVRKTAADHLVVSTPGIIGTYIGRAYAAEFFRIAKAGIANLITEKLRS